MTYTSHNLFHETQVALQVLELLVLRRVHGEHVQSSLHCGLCTTQIMAQQNVTACPSDAKTRTLNGCLTGRSSLRGNKLTPVRPRRKIERYSGNRSAHALDDIRFHKVIPGQVSVGWVRRHLQDRLDSIGVTYLEYTVKMSMTKGAVTRRKAHRKHTR